MIEAGSETTSQALNNCIIGLLSNPDAVRKAQEELDRVIGSSRSPTFDDEEKLPYVRAIIKVTITKTPVDCLGGSTMETSQQVWPESL
jgi:cytochrome P450